MEANFSNAKQIADFIKTLSREEKEKIFYMLQGYLLNNSLKLETEKGD